ncbi:MAG: metalloregulator ArsR/SmtB family transcription factor [Nitrospirae bacterium]|nr:metalloregulator ArsR/SmtB family transcription factor [Nitrospirota bacterium]MCL5421235.1 metalloregulator ArsR/SmtB family transcription factor [Nitrospirota bacterium]
MKKELLEFHAEFCKTFSNPKRLEILDLLKSGEMTVSALTGKLGVPKANVSQHLTVMRMMRILKTRRDGTNVYYRIANTKITQACSLMQVALAQLMKGVPVVHSKKI